MSAKISDCGQYRYTLTRGDAPRLCFVMLNPSTADATLDDPTIRRCLGYAKREGCAGLEVLNLYALRATNPADLWKHHDPVGPDNDRELYWAASRYMRMVAAWGGKCKALSRQTGSQHPGGERHNSLPSWIDERWIA